MFQYYFRKSVWKIQVSLKYDETEAQFIRTTMYIYGNVSPNVSRNEKCSDKVLEEKENTFYFK